MRIKIRLNDKFIDELEIVELLEIDGKPFVHPEDQEDQMNAVVERIEYMQGQLDLLSRAVLGAEG